MASRDVKQRMSVLANKARVGPKSKSKIQPPMPDRRDISYNSACSRSLVLTSRFCLRFSLILAQFRLNNYQKKKEKKRKKKKDTRIES